jgi:hypothetical protein
LIIDEKHAINLCAFFYFLSLSPNLKHPYMKKITLLFAFLLAFAANGYAQFPAPYCGPIVFSNNEEPITLVQFAGIDNATPAVVGQEAHQDFTLITGSVSTGLSYPIVLKGNTDGNFVTYLRVFIDWNQDADFADASESYDIGTIANSTGLDATQLTGSITVPLDATIGTTRMRIVKKWNLYSDSCNTIGTGYGEAEDYSLAVAAATCTQPTATFAVVSNCPAGTFNVTADITSMGDAAALSVTDNQSSPAQVVTATGLVTFGPYANGTSVVLTLVHDVSTACNITSTTMTQAACAPGCASAPSPVNMAVDVPYGAITLSWTAPTTGDPATSYDLYAGNTAATLGFVGNYTTTDTGTDLNITAYSATVYWQIIPKNDGGAATGCEVWSFTTEASPGYCLNGNLYPAATYVPETCDGVFVNQIIDNAWAGEYTMVTVTNGTPYTFMSSVSTDFITISVEDGNTPLAAGVTPLTWTSDVDGNIRFYIHTSDQCGTQDTPRTRSLVCGTPSADAPDYVSLQWPPTMTFVQGGSDTVYGQVWEPGVTDAAGQGAGITAWVGVNNANTDPATWQPTAWTEMTYNADCTTCGTANDEYMGQIGADLDSGTYYYATRFRLLEGGYVYGGINGTEGGNEWDGTTYVNGVLTVDAPAVPNNDECAGAIPLTPGGDFAAGAFTTTNYGGTSTTPASCQAVSDENVWYSVVVPASGTLTIETGDVDGSPYNDSVITVFSGTCGSLTEIDCDDDSSDNALFSLVELDGLTPGETLYISVWRYSDPGATGDWGAFQISAFDASLSVDQFNSNNFAVYPNPVKNVLNLSSTMADITNVAVFNLLGQQVIAKSVNAAQGQVDMSALPQGTYMVKITANNQVKTVKVIKE